MRYYKKGERYLKYLEARAAGTLHGLLSPQQAYDALREFEGHWRLFRVQRKILYKRQRQQERGAHALGSPLPIHDHKGNALNDEKYWGLVYEDAQRRSHAGEKQPATV